MRNKRPLPLPLGRAWAAVLWERLWPAVVPALCVLGLFAALALSDLLVALPGWLHGVVLAAFAAALAYAAYRGWASFRPIEEGEARHRLELDNALDHRPLTALDDRLAAGADDGAAVALWRLHQRRMAESARGLKVGPPAPGLARLDPFGLRALVLLVLVVGAVAGRDDPLDRLARALMPQFEGAGGGPVTVEVWITPPAYTRLAPLFLERSTALPDGPLKLPAGSAVLAQVGGLDGAPRLKAGALDVAFDPIGVAGGPTSYRVEAVIEAGNRLTVERSGRELAAWPLDVLGDGPPEVSFATPPVGNDLGHLRIEYQASDDYGLTGVVAEIERADGPGGTAGGETISIEMPLGVPGTKTAKGRSQRDLTAHPWAGLPVRMRLVATDAKGQTGNSDDVVLVLPERAFRHPVARAIIAERRKLSAPPPVPRAEVSAALMAIASRPERFAHDTVVFLALSVARSRLMRDQRDRAVASVQDILWDTALRVEDGEVSVAERRLMQAQERLMRALREGAENAEIERLMDELQRTLDEYMQALAEQLMRQGAPQMPMMPNMRMIARDDLSQMIERARELARMGSTDAARRMLSELRKMLQNMRAGMRPGRPGQSGKEFAKAQEAMNQLRDLVRRQQALLDKTFRRLQRQKGAMGKPGEGTGAQDKADAAEQESLRRGLGDLMGKLDEMLGRIPQSMGKAERAMRGAAGALEEARPGAAIGYQTEALEQLRQGAENAMEQMVRGMGGMIGFGPGRPLPMGSGQRPPDRDPFGRFREGEMGSYLEGDIEVPDEMEIRRAREILDELRRRSGQRRRPKLERDYIERLLRQF
jgi:uncharacterized protein (TIGR02302 family)